MTLTKAGSYRQPVELYQQWGWPEPASVDQRPDTLLHSGPSQAASPQTLAHLLEGPYSDKDLQNLSSLMIKVFGLDKRSRENKLNFYFCSSVLDLNAFERQNKAEGLGMVTEEGSGTISTRMLFIFWHILTQIVSWIWILIK